VTIKQVKQTALCILVVSNAKSKGKITPQKAEEIIKKLI
jgi:septum formation inhibitor-activating ATPase MinD